MRARSALVYTVLRLLAFVVPLGILLLFPVFQELPWLAAVFAALIGLSLSLPGSALPFIAQLGI